MLNEQEDKVKDKLVAVINKLLVVIVVLVLALILLPVIFYYETFQSLSINYSMFFCFAVKCTTKTAYIL